MYLKWGVLGVWCCLRSGGMGFLWLLFSSVFPALMPGVGCCGELAGVVANLVYLTRTCDCLEG